MGDCDAVEYAQAVHMSLAIRADALSDSSLICAHRAPPTSAYKAGLVIDDHVAFQEEEACTVFDPFNPMSPIPAMPPLESLEAHTRVSSLFRTYEDFNLSAHPGKAVHREFNGIFRGAQFDG